MARIGEVLQRGPSYSFEFFPPRSPAAAETLQRTIAQLAPLRPSYVSVTYGAGGSTRELTHEVVTGIEQDTDMTAMAHLTCTMHTRAQLADVVTRYREAGIENLLALRGDPPRDLEGEPPPSELDYATDLVALIRELGDFSIGVAIHPEGHPASSEREADLERQAAKLRVSDFGVSQFFFDAPVWSSFVDEMRSRGVEAPLVAGIMPVTSLRSVKRMAELSGADFPAWLEARLRAYEDDEDGQFRVGVEAATELCRELLASGVDGLHFYTLNRSPATREIYANLGLPD